MLRAYVNYPNPKIRIHADPNCNDVQKRGKVDQRFIKIDWDSISSELQRFAKKEHTFNADSGHNDMWIEINLGDGAFEFERSVLEYIAQQLGKRYEPFACV